MNNIKDFKDLEIWNRAMDMAVCIYKLSDELPDKEKYILLDQMKRAAISIPSNIAEGASGKSTKEFIQYLYISMGSASELETQLILTHRLGLSNNIDKKLSDLIIIKKMINALIGSLRRKSAADKN